MSTRKYWYKVYKRGEFKGLLPDPIDEFGYSLDINQAFTQLTLRIPTNLDDAGAEEVTETIGDNNGNPITDHNGNPLLSKLEYIFQTVPIDVGNRVTAYQSTDSNLNGDVVFDGVITTWSADTKSGVITLTILSSGVQMNNAFVGTPAGTPLVQMNSGVTQFYNLRNANDGIPAALNIGIGQTFVLPVTSPVSGIAFALLKNATYTGSQSAKLTLRVGAPNGSGAVLASAVRTIVSGSFYTWNVFTFPTPVLLAASTQYSATLEMEFQPYTYPIQVGARTDNPYSGGNGYIHQSPDTWLNNTGDDFHFQVIASAGSLQRQFLSTDPSTILRAILDYFVQQGGRISYDSTSIDDTNTIVSYTFKSVTVYEAVGKLLELAPANWYWFVDPGTNLLHFHRYGAVPDHIFYKGKHLSELTIEQTIEDMRNSVLFTGGDTGGGVNLVLSRSNTGSTSQYGVWLDRPSDNRITDSATADTVVRGILNQRSNPQFRTTIEIPATVYDIDSVSIGHMVAFRGFNSFIDGILLQVSNVDRKRRRLVLRLATSPPSVAHRIEDIRRNLDSILTQDNPSS